MRDKTVGWFYEVLVSLGTTRAVHKSLDVCEPLFPILPLHIPAPGFLTQAFRRCADKDHQPTEKQLKISNHHFIVHAIAIYYFFFMK